MAFKLGLTVDLCMDIHARFDELELDAKSQWVGKGKKSALIYLDNLASNNLNKH